MKKQLHLISDGKLTFKEFGNVAIAIEPYVNKFHIREKQKSAREIYEGVKAILDLGVPLNKIIINDRIDVAMALNTGIQLAYHSLPIKIVKNSFPQLYTGCSVHSLKEAIECEVNGADFLIYGHIFNSNSKPGLHPRGLEEIEEIRNSVKIPVIAIGGISPSNIKDVLKTNVDGIAVMSGILAAHDPVTMVKHYVEELHNWSGTK